MGFRPMSQEEITKIHKEQNKVKEEIALRQRYLAELEEEEKRGVWFSEIDFTRKAQEVKP